MRRLPQLKRLRDFGQRAASSGPPKTGKGKGKGKDTGKGTDLQAGKDDVPHKRDDMADASIRAVAPGPSNEAGKPESGEAKGPEDALHMASKPFPFPPKPPGGPQERPDKSPPTFPGKGPEHYQAKTAEQSGKGNSSRDNTWLLSRSFPVDVRLLVAALAAGSGGLTYWWFEKENELNQAPAAARQDAANSEFERRSEPFEASASHHQQVQEDSAQDGEQVPQALQSDFYSDELAMQAGQDTESIEDSARSDAVSAANDDKAAESQEGAPSLSPAEAEAHSQAVADVLNSVLASQIQVVDAEKEEDELKTRLADQAPGESTGTPNAAGSENEQARQEAEARIADADGRRRTSERKLQETLSVLKENVADTSGETLWSSASSHVRTPQQPAGDAGPDAGAGAASSTVEQPEEEIANTVLGIQEDLRPAALVRRAIDRGEGSRDNWAEFQHRLKQAESDALTFSAAKRQALATKQEEIAKLQQEIDGRDKLLQAAEEKMAENIANFKTAPYTELLKRTRLQALQDQKKVLSEQKQEELKKQAEQLSSAFADAAVKERASRLGALNQVRMKLNSLMRAFGRRSDESATSHSVHKLTLGVFALNNALEGGQPIGQQKASLQSACKDDVLVSLAVNSLPDLTDSQGIATRSQLLQKWPDVRQTSSQLSQLPAGQTSFLQLGLASLASRLKVQETAQPPSDSAMSADQVLAHAEAHLVQGNYTEAARCLERGLSGTAAEAAVSSWTGKLRARAIADQAVKVLQAHASAQAASVS